MIQEETTTIAGKEVKLAYIYATEVAYKKATDENIHSAITDISRAITAKQSPDTEKSIYLILAAHQAYNFAHDIEEPSIIDKDLMKNAKPKELATAVMLIIKMYGEFYEIPVDEPEPQKGNSKGKN
jgi:hypothetical protein